MLTGLFVVALGSGASAWLGWSLAGDLGILERYLCANVGFAFGWYFSRKFVREHLDL